MPTNTTTEITVFSTSVHGVLDASLHRDGLLQVSECYDSEVLAEAKDVRDADHAREVLIKMCGEVGRVIPIQVEGKDFTL